MRLLILYCCLAWVFIVVLGSWIARAVKGGAKMPDRLDIPWGWIVLVLIVEACLVVAILGATGVIHAQSWQLGDANHDGNITMADVTTVERMILQLDPQNIEADANQNGEVNMGDVTQIERFILGLDPIPRPRVVEKEYGVW